MTQYESYDELEVKEGNIYLFDDIDYVGKIKCTRPIIVVKTLSESGTFLGFKLTSTERDWDRYSYLLQDWSESGLKKQSSVRCDKPLFLNRGALHTPTQQESQKPYSIGTVSPRDMRAISDLFASYTKGLTKLAEEVRKQTDQKIAYVIRQTDKYANGAEHIECKIYETLDDLTKDWNRARGAKSTVLVDGKLIVKATSFEKGFVTVAQDGTINSNEIKVIAKKHYDDLLKENSRKGGRK